MLVYDMDTFCALICYSFENGRVVKTDNCLLRVNSCFINKTKGESDFIRHKRGL